METKVILIEEEKISREAVGEAGKIIKNGGLVAFPTETVYGLGGNALDEKASEKIYRAKGRPSDNPLIVHICRIEDMYSIVKEVPEAAKKLADAFWPGPLTMILEKNEKIPYATTGGLDTVAVRMPAHKAALAFIDAAGGYVAAPSANRSGKPSPTLARYVMEDMDGRIDMIIDGGEPHRAGVDDCRPDGRSSFDPSARLYYAGDAGKGSGPCGNGPGGDAGRRWTGSKGSRNEIQALFPGRGTDDHQRQRRKSGGRDQPQKR